MDLGTMMIIISINQVGTNVCMYVCTVMPVICAKISETKPSREESKSKLGTQQSVAPRVVPIDWIAVSCPCC